MLGGWRIAAAVCLLGLFPPALAGCGNERRLPTAAAPPATANMGSAPGRFALDPVSNRREGFAPLDIGNEWEYAGEVTRTFVPRGGEAYWTRGSWYRWGTLSGSEPIDGRDYVREEGGVDLRTGSGRTFHSTVQWFRQDRSGLIGFGPPPPPVNLPPAPAAGDTSHQERTLLAYPLHVGASWVISTAPRITAEVERQEDLRTLAGSFPAWRIRLRKQDQPAGDEVFAWYGEAGYLGARGHSVTGSPGSDLVITEDWSERLVGLRLARGGPRAAVIREAVMALEAILSGEQTYYQKAITGTPSYTDDLPRLNIDLSRASARWDFSVHDVTPLGFVAEARGRDQTETANIVVSLRYVGGQPPVWSVKHGPKPKWVVGDPRAGYVAQAEGALGAIITAEQFYYQRSVGGTPSYTDDLTQLNIDLSDLTYRWAFSVYDATPLGFVAEARGHDQPEAANIIVSVRYVRGQSPVWSVEYTDAGRKHRGRT